MARLPKNDDLAYLFIVDCFVKNGRQPSLQAIADRFGFGSKRSSVLLLTRLAKAGRITYDKGVVGLVSVPHTSASENTVRVPVVGMASCGMLNLAEQVFENEVHVSTLLARPPYKYFVLRAEGASMNRSGINDGDLVLIRQQSTANEGERVVALVDNEATIKHFHREKGFVVLKPNSTDETIKPIILSEEFSIQGVVVTTLPDPF